MFSIEIGFKFRYVKNDNVRITAECFYKASTGCGWYVHGRVENDNSFFYVRDLLNEHTCGSAYKTTKHPRISSELVASLIVEEIKGRPLTPTVDFIYYVQNNYGLIMNYHLAWWAVERAKQQIYGDQSASFDRLRWYREALLSSNPGSIFEIDYDDDSGRFKKLFVSFHACIEGFKFCRPLLFLDGTFLKS